MTGEDRTVQVPVSLPTREQIAEAIAKAENADYWIGEIREWETREAWERETYAEDRPDGAYEDRDFYLRVADAVLALLSQPTTTAEPDAARAEAYRQGWAAGHAAPHVPGVRGDIAEPPRIEDMAPGTRFVGRHVDPEECGGVDHAWFVIRPGARPLVVSDEGQHWSGDSIDPSTIRDVTPPAGS